MLRELVSLNWRDGGEGREEGGRGGLIFSFSSIPSLNEKERERLRFVCIRTHDKANYSYYD